MLKVTSAALLAFICFLITHFTYFYYCFPENKVNALLYIALSGILAFLFFLYLFPGEIWFQQKLQLSEKNMYQWVYPAFGILLYAFLFLGYLEFYFTADRSITFRILMITSKQPHHAVTQAKMSELYDVPGILQKRFDDLTYGGYFEKQGETYQLTTKGTLILNIYRIAINTLHFNTGESHQKPPSRTAETH